MPADLEKSAVATRLENVSFHSNPKERQCQKMFKISHHCTHLTHLQSNAQNSPSQASTICEPRTPDVQAGFRKCRGTRDQITNICCIIEKVREFKKNIYFIDYPQSLWLCGNCGKFLNRWKYQTTLPASWEISVQVKRQQSEPDTHTHTNMDTEQQTGSRSGKEYIKAVYVTLLI